MAWTADSTAVDLLLADLVLAGRCAAVIWWAWRHPLRLVPFAVAVAAAAAFTVVRNQYKLEDSVASSFLPLAVSCAVAAALASAFLVPILYGGYLAVALTACGLTSCDYS